MSTPTLKTAIIEKKIWVAPQLTDEDIKSTNAGLFHLHHEFIGPITSYRS